MKKVERKGKVFVDWSQNHRSKTTIAVYSLRARERPTVSTPVTWDEVERAAESGRPARLVFEAGDVLKRIEKHGDLFAPVLELKQKLPELVAALERLADDRLAGRLDLVEAADRGRVGRLLGDLGVAPRPRRGSPRSPRRRRRGSPCVSVSVGSTISASSTSSGK